MNVVGRVRAFLKNRVDSPAESRFIVGVSGGPDSFALADVLRRLRERLGYSLAVAHVNYRRHDQADRAERTVRDWCEQTDVPYLGLCVRNDWNCDKDRRGTEGMLRDIRIEFFQSLFERGEFDGVFLAHHADDQVETVLLNLGRGTGTRGAGGMKPVDNVGGLRLLRPFIKLDKKELQRYCVAQDLPVVDDPTNQSLEHTRNGLRHKVLPAWKSVQENPSRSLRRFSDLARRENDFWDEFLVERVPYRRWDHEIQVLRDPFLDLHEAVQNRFLHAVPRWLTGTARGWSRRNVEELRALFDRGSGRGLDCPGPVRAVVEYDRVSLYRTDVLVEGVYPFTPGSRRFRHRVGSLGSLLFGGHDDVKECVWASPVDTNTPVVQVRNWRSGDRIHIDGEEITVKERFQEQRIPYRARRLWPIVEFTGHRLGLPGLGISGEIKHNETRHWMGFRAEHPVFDALPENSVPPPVEQGNAWAGGLS